jgi:crotonobetainyl-CoA:carnitine CoA-transferase CaiB-like acyl-CoA transferase
VPGIGPLDGLVVVETGRRTAVRACGTLLAQAGATVFFVRDSDPDGAEPVTLFAGKQALPREPDLIAAALARADVLVGSSDLPEPAVAALARSAAGLIVCDITAGLAAAKPASDKLVQAAMGLADITGLADHPPVVSDAPVTEFQAGMYAAAAIVACALVREETGEGQEVALTLADVAVNTLSSFLPLVFGGKMPKRAGNRHPMAVPWNSYRAADGWILLCSATDEHWRKLATLMGRPELAVGALAKLADRIAQCDEVDSLVEEWSAGRTVAQCIAQLADAGVAAGPIVTLDEMQEEENLRHRATILRVEDPVRGKPVALPRSFLRPPEQPQELSFTTGEAGAEALRRLPASVPRQQLAAQGRLPLAGLRVLEIGQYTTAPLAAKQLALLGADVIKIEPIEGEASRAWPPHQGGQGYFFTMNNANKRSCALDLKADDGAAVLRALLAEADVLLENMKPGSLARLGFDWEELSRLNERLVYCPISGFGLDSAYPGRPAFDTVVQAMSGLMDLTRADGTPTKLGISVCDISGGIAALFSILVALKARIQTGRGRLIDLSMQDVAVWMTQAAWNHAAREPHAVLPCADGYVVAASASDALGSTCFTGMPRLAAVAALAARGIASAPVRSVEEIATDPTIVGAGAVETVRGPDGVAWPLFRSVFRFSSILTVPVQPIGPLGEATDAAAAGRAWRA